MRSFLAAVLGVGLLTALVPAYAQDHGDRRSNVERTAQDLHERIDGDSRLSADEKARYHAQVVAAETEAAAIEASTQEIVRLSKSGNALPEAEAESEIRKTLARAGLSHAKLGVLRQELHTEIRSSAELTGSRKLTSKRSRKKQPAARSVSRMPSRRSRRSKAARLD
jgi:hypothetical protein